MLHLPLVGAQRRNPRWHEVSQVFFTKQPLSNIYHQAVLAGRLFLSQKNMGYHFSKIVQMDFEAAVAAVTAALQAEGFGVLTDIDLKATFQKKLGVDFRPYRILGACHAPSAYQALQAEERIGLMLPCNVIVRETAAGAVEVSAVDPVASMQAIHSESLGEVATSVQEKLRRVVERV